MRKKIIDASEVSKECRNCAYGTFLADEEQILCKKSGIRNLDSTCKKFRYDPLCRIPRRNPEMPGFSEEDFEL